MLKTKPLVTGSQNDTHHTGENKYELPFKKNLIKAGRKKTYLMTRVGRCSRQY